MSWLRDALCRGQGASYGWQRFVGDLERVAAGGADHTEGPELPQASRDHSLPKSGGNPAAQSLRGGQSKRRSSKMTTRQSRLFRERYLDPILPACAAGGKLGE